MEEKYVLTFPSPKELTHRLQESTWESQLVGTEINEEEELAEAPQTEVDMNAVVAVNHLEVMAHMKGHTIKAVKCIRMYLLTPRATENPNTVAAQLLALMKAVLMRVIRITAAAATMLLVNIIITAEMDTTAKDLRLLTGAVMVEAVAAAVEVAIVNIVVRVRIHRASTTIKRRRQDLLIIFFNYSI